MSITSLEFYSGIGGMHYALKEACSSASVLSAFDINTSSNAIYRHNFPNVALKQGNIQGVSLQQLEKWNADLWTMSPPCQPFTRKGLQLAEEDARTDSFFYLLERLSEMSCPPRYFLLENVVGFESSKVRDHVVELLTGLGYKTQEYVLSPVQCGIPNARPRYYLLASNKDLFPSCPLTTCSPLCSQVGLVKTVASFLDPTTPDSLIIDAKLLTKYAYTLNVVTDSSVKSACFTKSYGVYANGCGSVYSSDPNIVENNKIKSEYLSDVSYLQSKLRWLSPREVANLMCFPASFSQPPNCSRKQMYRALGNSVNIFVVTVLMKHLLSHN